MSARPFPKETWKHRNIFETYLLMGPSRTLTDLSRRTNVGIKSILLWSKAFRWKEKIEQKDKKAMELIEKDNEQLYVDTVKRRQQEAYLEVQEKALKKIRSKKGVSFESDKDAAIALDIGIKGERNVLGLSETKIKGAMVKEGFAAFVEATFAGE